MNKYNNIDSIINEFKKQDTDIIVFRKVDGITMECALVENKNANTVIPVIDNICKELKLPSHLVEVNKEKSNIFIVQFPDLNTKHTEEELIKIYKDIFKWVLDNLYHNDVERDITKQVLIDNKQIITKQAIMIYYKSNVNMYKEKLQDYYNNIDYRNKIDNIFLDFINTYEYKE